MSDITEQTIDNDYAVQRLMGWTRHADGAYANYEEGIRVNGNDIALIGVDWRRDEDNQEIKDFLGRLGIRNFVNGLPYYDQEPGVTDTGKSKSMHDYRVTIVGNSAFTLRERRVILPRENTAVLSWFVLERTMLPIRK